MSPPQTLSSIVEPTEIKVNGTKVAASVIADLLDVRVQLVLNGVSQALLRLFDADFKLIDSATFELGNEVDVAFANTGQVPASVFKGEVVSLASEQGPTDLHELVVTCFDKAHRLARSTGAKTYQDVTYSDVIGQIARAHGLGTSFAAGFGEIQHPYLLQTTDDAAFVAELVRRSGFQWRIDGATLQVIDGTAAAPVATLTFGETLLRFRSRLNAGPALDDVSVYAWDPLTKRAITGTANIPSGHALSSASGLADAQTKGKAMSSPKRVGTRQVFTSVTEANLVASAMRQEIAASALTARGESFGSPTILAGTKVTIDGVGTRLSGDYFLTEVEHVYSRNGYVTRFHAGPIAGGGITDLVGGGTLPTTHLAPVIGIVTNNNDTQNGHQGVVRVKFPGFGDNIESAWARVVSIGAGASRGMQALPAVNDEVLVVFEGGDYRRPLVLGGVWNGQDAPKIAAATTTANGAVVQWAITTAKGQQLLFDDSTDDSLNILADVGYGTTKLYLGKDRVELFSQSASIELKCKTADILMDGQRGDITIRGSNINLQASQAIKLSANSAVDIVSQSQAKLQGLTVEVKGLTKTDVGGPGTMTSVTGTPVKIN